MALLERLYDVNHSGCNFFDHVFADAYTRMAAAMAEMNTLRGQMFQLMPHDLIGDTLAPVAESYNPIVQENGETKLKLKFNVHDFRPEEVKVKMLGNNKLQVRAEQEVKADDGSVKRRVYVSHHTIPKGVDVEHIRPILSNDGVLTIEAAAPGLTPSERVLPIECRTEDAAEKK